MSRCVLEPMFVYNVRLYGLLDFLFSILNMFDVRSLAGDRCTPTGNTQSQSSP